MPNVSNSGNSKLRYSISGVATSAPLAAALVITIKQPDGNSGSSCSAFSGLALDTLCFRVTLPLGTSFPGSPGSDDKHYPYVRRRTDRQQPAIIGRTDLGSASVAGRTERQTSRHSTVRAP
jgi:hypothetical protein